MPFTQAQLDALDQFIATGQLAVQYADRSVTSRSLDEMLKLRELMVADIADAAAPDATPRPRSWGVYSTKGF